MDFSQDDLKMLVQNPRESLGVELKQWVDPATPEGIAKIAKGCIALRNNNGGFLLIGFTNSGAPDAPNVPGDVREAFHPDVVQQIVSKYASEAFEVAVEFVERDGNEYPVLCVPSGVRTPVAAKSDLADSAGRPLIRTDAVYVRSLNSNNIVSSTAARWKDWEQVTRNCFENRQADIGAFLRRHLTRLDRHALTEVLAQADMDEQPEEEEEQIDLIEAFRSQREWSPDSVCDDLDGVIGKYARSRKASDVLSASEALRQGAACLQRFMKSDDGLDPEFRHALGEIAALMLDMAAFGCEHGNHDLFWTLGNHYIVTLHNLLAENEEKC